MSQKVRSKMDRAYCNGFAAGGAAPGCPLRRHSFLGQMIRSGNYFSHFGPASIENKNKTQKHCKTVAIYKYSCNSLKTIQKSQGCYDWCRGTEPEGPPPSCSCFSNRFSSSTSACSPFALPPMPPRKQPVDAPSFAVGNPSSCDSH
jgi:hypothetical protein